MPDPQIPPPPPPPATPTVPRREGFPYQSYPLLAAGLFAAGLAVIAFTGLWYWVKGTSPGYTGGGAAAAAGVLFVLALIVHAPSLIMDDTVQEGGEPSTMRILMLAIVLTFCVLMLRTGWNQGTLPSLEKENNWVWLVTAALGGKALQKFAEVQEKKAGK